jgi:hypothetical protein
MQTPYGYDSTTITVHYRAIDRAAEAGRDQWIAAAAPQRTRPLLAAFGRRCVRAGEWLQQTARPADQRVPLFAKEHVQ